MCAAQGFRFRQAAQQHAAADGLRAGDRHPDRDRARQRSAVLVRPCARTNQRYAALLGSLTWSGAIATARPLRQQHRRGVAPRRGSAPASDARRMVESVSLISEPLSKTWYRRQPQRPSERMPKVWPAQGVQRRSKSSGTPDRSELPLAAARNLLPAYETKWARPEPGFADKLKAPPSEHSSSPRAGGGSARAVRFRSSPRLVNVGSVEIFRVAGRKGMARVVNFDPRQHAPVRPDGHA